MKKTRELWWFLIPWLVLSILETFFTLRDTLISQLIPSLTVSSFLPNLLLAWLGELAWTAVLGALVGGVLLLVRRRVSFSRRRFYVLVFLVTALLNVLFYFVQLRWMVISPRVLVGILQAGNATAFTVWLAELVIQTIKKRKKEDQ